MEMAKADGAKEEIGWLKVLFAVGAAIDASLIAWLAQNQERVSVVLVALALVAAVLLSVCVARINTVAYRRINDLKDLG